MKIHFIGLSAFLIENAKGYRILVDPFNDAPEWRLGPSFPKEFRGKPFGANIVLHSEPDADHSFSPGGWLQNAPGTKLDSDPFPALNLRGTVVYEWNGDLNVAYHYTVDGIRLAHFADNAHLLNALQLKELGHPDVVFMSAPKVATEPALEIVRANLRALDPKLVVWAHHLAPEKMPSVEDPDSLRRFFVDYFRANASTNKGYADETSFMELVTVLKNAWKLNTELGGMNVGGTEIEVRLDNLKGKSLLFTRMLAKP